ncbi:hypothetical protein E3N88_44828 [Mikania micrantha]|uniref:Myb/SANT-like DNA-binding domain-containing protein n=1 Tax=Mikania micrantha TaxID=192012 RepID=A0A5N6LAW5_9ASTR|nr:hypothetical protein E3N88_44828 [Mikania micrantha]
MTPNCMEVWNQKRTGVERCCDCLPVRCVLEKFIQLNRGNLRVREWEELSASVSEMCENQSKSVEQCKNKVDNLKKRYKLERNRCLTNNGGNAANKSVGGMNSSDRQSKRYTTASSSPSGHIANMEPKSVAMLIAREVSMTCQMGVEYDGNCDEFHTTPINVRKIGSLGNCAICFLFSGILADAVIKGSNLHDVYEYDTTGSVAYEHNNFRELASRSSLDMMAATFCEENSNPDGQNLIPATFSVAVVIFSLHEPGNISRALSGENIGTLIDQTGRSG